MCGRSVVDWHLDGGEMGGGTVMPLLPQVSLAHEEGSGKNGTREGAAILNDGHDGVQRVQVNGSWARLVEGEHVWAARDWLTRTGPLAPGEVWEQSSVGAECTDGVIDQTCRAAECRMA